MAATPDQRGDWFVATDGGTFTFGDAGFFASAGSLRAQPALVGMGMGRRGPAAGASGHEPVENVVPHVEVACGELARRLFGRRVSAFNRP
jgi:hypothetical protein